MDDPQIWTMLAMFAGFFGVFSTLFYALLRSTASEIKAEIKADFKAEISRLDSKIDAVDSKVDRLDAKLDSVDERSLVRDRALEGLMNARFDDVAHRLDTVEDDMKLVKAHLIGQRSA